MERTRGKQAERLRLCQPRKHTEGSVLPGKALGPSWVLLGLKQPEVPSDLQTGMGERCRAQDAHASWSPHLCPGLPLAFPLHRCPWGLLVGLGLRTGASAGAGEQLPHFHGTSS